jgi:uncharacterized repeat protein (TIGR01451 family)
MKTRLLLVLQTSCCFLLGALTSVAQAQCSEDLRDCPSKTSESVSPRALVSDAAIAGKALTDLNPKLAADYGKLPLRFEENRGQVSVPVEYVARGLSYSMFLTREEAVLSLVKPTPHPDLRSNMQALQNRGSMMTTESTPTVLRMRFASQSAQPRVAQADELPGTSNYFIGSDPKNWRSEVPSYSRVRYDNVYPGVDLLFYGTQKQLEYDFVVSPGGDPRSIRLTYDGAQKVHLNQRGDLVLQAPGGAVIQRKPIVYQVVDGARKPVTGRYVMTGKREVGFAVGTYDRSRALVLDPVVSYSTYLGGSVDDEAYAIAVDPSGNAYVTGRTQSLNFPTSSPFQPTYKGNTDVFVTKFNPTGTALVYSTYLGGNGMDIGYGIAADGSGNAYVTGGTTSTNFPTMKYIQTHGGIFLTKLSPTGGMDYSTYYGGSNSEYGKAIAIDSTGNAFITGITASKDFPTKNAFQSTYGGGSDAFVVEINTAGSTAIYSTYLGGSSQDSGNGIAVDSLGSAYVTGETKSINFPTHNPLQSTTSGDSIFVAKLTPGGNGLVYSTYFGGNAGQAGAAIAIDPAKNVYVTGTTNSGNFPLHNPFRNNFAFAYAFKLNPAGNALIYSTYLGGKSVDTGTGIAADSAGNAYITGYTQSTDFPTHNPVQPALAGLSDAFLLVFNPTGSALVYSSYLGGTNNDYGRGIAFDGNGAAYVSGFTASANFPTKSPHQAVYGGPPYDAFVTKTQIYVPADLAITKTASPNPVVHGSNLTYSLHVSNAGPGPATNVVISDPIPTGTTFSSFSTTTATCTAPAAGGTGTLTCKRPSLVMGGSIAVTLVVTVKAAAGSTVRNTATVSASTPDPKLANNTATTTTSVH